MSRKSKNLIMLFVLLTQWVFSTLPVMAQTTGEEGANHIYLPSIWGDAAQGTDQQTADQQPTDVLSLEQQTDTQVVAAGASTTGATIVSDLADYPPGATVTLTGAGWAAGESVDIFVNDDSSNSWVHSSNPDPVADGNGAFTYAFQLPNWFVANYSVIATGSTSGVATTTFTDEELSWDQCQNDTNPNDNIQDPCAWTNGALNTNNSIYAEGDVVPQRHIRGVASAGNHFTTFDHSFYDQAKDAYTYDFWATPDFTVNGNLNPCNDLANSLGLTTAQCVTLFNAKQEILLPTESAYTIGANTFTYPFVAGAEANAALDGVTRKLWISCGVAGGTKQNPTITTGACTNVSITILGHGNSNGTLLPNSQQQGPPTADEFVQMRVSYTTPASTFVAIWVGGHLAKGSYWNDPVDITNNAFLGFGSSTAAGASFHQRLNGWDLNSAIGNRDNQIQNSGGTVVPPGSITIIKDDTTNSGTSFNFTSEFPLTPPAFSLSDDGVNANNQNRQVFSDLLTGDYTISEPATTGWALTSLTCSSDAGTSTYTGTGTPPAGSSVVIKLQPGDNVTCTFTNSPVVQKKDLTVTKTATPNLTRTYTWDISKNVDKTQVNIADGGTATFNYTVDVTHDSGTDSGWAVNGTITVNNPNSFSVSGVSVTDAIEANANCTVSGGSSTISANSSATFNYTCTYGQAPAATSQTNTATASWTAFGSPNTSATGTAAVDWSSATVTVKDGSVTVTDPNAPTPPLPATVSYTDASPKTFTYAKTFSGDPAGTCTTHNNTATFTTNDSQTTGTASQSVKVCVGKDLTVTKTAAGTYSREYFWKISKDVDQTQVEIAEGGSYTFHYTVVAEQTGVTDSGWTLAGKITISNPNDWEAITLSSLSDTVNNGGSCTVDPGPYVIPVSGSLEVSYSCTYASAPSSNSGTNTATATWDKATYFTPSGSASGSKDFTLTQAGSTNKTIHVTDSYAGDLGTVTGTDSVPFAKSSFTYDRTESGVAGKCTDYDNTATIKETGQSAAQGVTLCVGKDLVVEKTATASYDRTYKWLIDKRVDDTRIEIGDGGTATFNYTVEVKPDGYTDSGYTLGGTIKVTNPNEWEDITADVTDALDQGGSCTVTNGTGVVIPAGQSVTLDYTCTTDGSSTKNTATASWDKATYATPNDSASGEADVTFALDQEINKSITVVDNKTTNANVTLGTSDYANGPFLFTYALDKSGVAGKCTDYTNTAAIDETGQSDTQKVTVCVGKDLTVTKTANSAFKRTYTWDIGKAVDKTLVKQLGGSVTFNYTVNVTQTGFTDSEWVVKGTITVVNPNDWEEISATVSDAVDNGGSCSLDNPAQATVTVPKSGSVNIAYTCTFSSGSSGSNTATVTWDKAAAFTPSDTASGMAAFAFTTPTTTVNKTITVKDTFNGGTPMTLGTVTATDSTPYTKQKFTYARTVTVPANGCVTYNNTAQIVETGQQASQSVKVCGPIKTGARTIGFWQNKNGQGIITSGASTSGVCNVGTWLRQFAPFQDLSATATCSQVATYVTNVIKAANASGSSMNAMLKAQMLATALDVYFSNSALGGNKLSAPAPIGGLTIDLTKICKMIDGSSGTATCSGTFQNVSSAFGGATSLTIMQMLTYAASQSNVGGSTWYGNVKATQEMAKNAFDAINNEVAFAP